LKTCFEAPSSPCDVVAVVVGVEEEGEAKVGSFVVWAEEHSGFSGLEQLCQQYPLDRLGCAPVG